MIEHGGLVDAELEALGIDPGEVLDLSVNVNPYGPCASVRRAITRARIDRYPDPHATAARRALAARNGVEPGRVVLGNGAVDLLWCLARSVLRAGDAVVIVEPAFSEMRSAARAAGAAIVSYKTSFEHNFRLDVSGLDRTLAQVRPRIAYVATPSNPAGVCTPIAELSELAARHPYTLMVVDASFLSMSTDHQDADAPPPNVFWLRSLTKDHALAGLRVGFSVTTPELADRLAASRPPWSVNGLAQAAAVATTNDDARRFVDESRRRLFADRARLAQALDLPVHPSDTIFLLADVGRAATGLRQALLTRHRILIRDATSFGLPHHVRIAARPNMERLVTAFRTELL